MAKKICIAFPRGGIIPASVMAARADVTVGAMTPIDVPEDYGRHLIDDRFAVLAEMPKKDDAKAERKAAAEKAEAERKAAAEKAEAERKAAAEKAEAERKDAVEKALAVKLAEEAVATAKAKVGAAGGDMVAKAAAEDELKVAEAALAGLKG